MAKYELCVGNIGTFDVGNNPIMARKKYGEVVRLSKEGHGRVSGEDVALLEDGEPILEYSARLGEE